jgi:queuine tRNA-ribosyltransferase
MRIISFENDLDSLKLALLRNDLFPYVRHAGPATIAARGEWQSKQFSALSWSLILGDFPNTIADAPAPPDLIFYDMFSSKTSADVWTFDDFRRLFAVCHNRATELFTYTCSTSVRSALLAAGFYVAKGRSIGAKEETTIALTSAALHREAAKRYALLSSAWIGRWQRSQAKFPLGIEPAEHAGFERVIRGHQQFQPS